MTEQKLYTVAVNLAADRQILIGDVSSISHGEDGTLYISSFSPAGNERGAAFAPGKWIYYEWVDLESGTKSESN